MDLVEVGEEAAAPFAERASVVGLDTSVQYSG